MMTRLGMHAGLWMVLAFLGAGCSLITAPDVEQTRFFVLTGSADDSRSTSVAGRPATPLPDLAIGVGPITLPGYLDRPQMVTRLEPNEIEVSEVNRWAEPLRTSFPRALGEDLGRELGTDRIVIFPWYKVELDYQVKVEVLNFEPWSDGRVALDAIWTLYQPKTNRHLATQQTALRRTIEAGDTDALAGALSELVGDLGAEIAKAIRRSQPAHGS